MTLVAVRVGGWLGVGAGRSAARRKLAGQFDKPDGLGAMAQGKALLAGVDHPSLRQAQRLAGVISPRITPVTVA